MAALNIRNLDETVKRRLQVRAARHDRSMEAEVRAILAEAVREPADSARQSSAVHGLSGVGGTSSATATSAPVSRART